MKQIIRHLFTCSMIMKISNKLYFKQVWFSVTMTRKWTSGKTSPLIFYRKMLEWGEVGKKEVVDHINFTFFWRFLKYLAPTNGDSLYISIVHTWSNNDIRVSTHCTSRINCSIQLQTTKATILKIIKNGKKQHWDDDFNCLVIRSSYRNFKTSRHSSIAQLQCIVMILSTGVPDCNKWRHKVIWDSIKMIRIKILSTTVLPQNFISLCWEFFRRPIN